LKLAAAPALSITIRSLSCRSRPEAEKFAAPVRRQLAVDLVALEVHRIAGLVLDPYLDAGVPELAGERWPDVAEQAPTVYAVWGGGATPAQALYMVGLILPP
jgi:hypothetical protein